MTLKQAITVLHPCEPSLQDFILHFKSTTMRQTLLYLAMGLCIVFVFSCEKMIKIDAPRTQLTTDKVFTNDQSALAVLVSIYSTVNNSVASNIAPFVGLYSDELISNSSNAGTVEFYNSHLSANNTPNHNVWRSLYSVIYQCNAFLEAIAISESVPAASKEFYKGEALFLRSFAYFYLVQLYGNVPLLLETDVRVTSVATRTEQAVIYSQCISDLLISKQLLSVDYVTGERVRANKWAVVALLARYYIQQEKWADAEQACAEIINSGMYTLTSNATNVFLKNSSESILQCWTQNGFTQVGSVLVPSGTNVPTYQVSTSLMQRFEAGDQRRMHWVRSIVNNGQTYYHVYKYKQRVSTSGSSAEYTMLFRLGEIYLLRAECRLKQSKYTDAMADVNIMRQRAGLPLLMGAQPNQVKEAIEQENCVELFAEWGIRFFCLKRTQQLDAALQSLKPNWDSRRQLLPIPQYELLNNSQLSQNPGY
jgi:hypothetical protein